MRQSRLLGAVCACMFFASGFFTIAEAAVTNGSLTGTVGANTAAPGWTAFDAIPDLVDANGVNGQFNFTGVPWTLSPDGGTFARVNGTVNPTYREAFEQAVDGFTVGETYTLQFFQTNLGFRVKWEAP